MCPCEERRAPPGVYWTTQPARTRDYAAPMPMPMSGRRRPPTSEKCDPFHIVQKVPSGDSPYVRAKHAQLIFWAAINAVDRFDSALKDMAVVMKQLDRSDEGIEAIKSFRYLCSLESQDSIDNLLLELYKKSGRIEEEAELLERKLKTVEQGMGFGGRIIRAKKVQGKHVTMTIDQEKARRALCLEPDKNKLCNLAICLIHMGRIPEAKSLINHGRGDSSVESNCGDEPFAKSYDRAVEMLAEIESKNLER